MLDFDKLVEKQFQATTTMQQKSHEKFVQQYNTGKFKFTPSKGAIATVEPKKEVIAVKVKSEEPQIQKSTVSQVVGSFMDLEAQNISRKDAIERAGVGLKKEERISSKVTMANAAFGVPGLVDQTMKDFQKDKRSKNKNVMNEQNWHLLQQDKNLYIPNKLPFFKEQAATEEVEQEPQLQRAKSHATDVEVGLKVEED